LSLHIGIVRFLIF